MLPARWLLGATMPVSLRLARVGVDDRFDLLESCHPLERLGDGVQSNACVTVRGANASATGWSAALFAP